MMNYLTESERRHEWFTCLNALDNFLWKHSDCIKHLKMNNYKGTHKIIKELIQNLDSFVVNQEDTEIIITKEDK